MNKKMLSLDCVKAQRFFEKSSVGRSKVAQKEGRDYSPFGLELTNKQYTNGEEYRFGFNGKENDNDFGDGVQDYGMRIYDSRIVRFKSVDPLAPEYPSLSGYNFVANSPLIFVDSDGERIVWSKATQRKDKKTVLKIVRKLKRSGIFRKIWKQLKRSDKVFTMDVDRQLAKIGYFDTYLPNPSGGKPIKISGVAGLFDPFYGKKGIKPKPVTLPDGQTVYDPGLTDAPTKELGGIIRINPTVLDQRDEEGKQTEQTIIEELIHAGQYDLYVTSPDNAYKEDVPGVLNFEFEAKVLTGKVLEQSKIFSEAQILYEDRMPFMQGRYFNKDSFKTYWEGFDKDYNMIGFRNWIEFGLVDDYNGSTKDTKGAVTDDEPALLKKLIDK